MIDQSRNTRNSPEDAVAELAAEPDEGTHVLEQAAQPELGGEVAPKRGRGVKKRVGRGAAKAPTLPKVWTPGQRGVRRDGRPRKAPGTNEPRSEAAERFGHKISKLRQAKGWTQRDLATKAGLSQSGIANIERGVAHAGPRSYPGIAKALGLDPSDAPVSERKPRTRKAVSGEAPASPKKRATKVAKKTAKKIAKKTAKKRAKKAAKKAAK